jgi:hypothetical protein
VVPGSRLHFEAYWLKLVTKPFLNQPMAKKKNKKRKKLGCQAGVVAQAVECLSRKHKALSSKPHTAKKKWDFQLAWTS